MGMTHHRLGTACLRPRHTVGHTAGLLLDTDRRQGLAEATTRRRLGTVRATMPRHQDTARATKRLRTARATMGLRQGMVDHHQSMERGMKHHHPVMVRVPRKVLLVGAMGGRRQIMARATGALHPGTARAMTDHHRVMVRAIGHTSVAGLNHIVATRFWIMATY